MDSRTTTNDDRLAGFDGSLCLRAWTTQRKLDAPDVVVVGAGIAGTQLAARLARRGAKVALVTGGPLPPRRLIDGCSLRRATLATMAEAMGIDVARLQAALGGEQGAFGRLRITATRSETPELSPQFEAGDDTAAIGLSARHGDIICALRRFVPLEVSLVPGEVSAYHEDQHRLRLSLAGGEACDWPLPPRTTIVNAQSRRIDGGTSTAPQRWVAAAQQPLVMPAGTLERIGWAPSFAGTLGWHLGFVTPFWDSQNRGANAYAIDTMVLDDATVQRVGKEAVLAEVRGGLARCVEAAGATALDPDETTGAALVPVHEQFAPTLQGGLVDLHAALSPGAPAINVDGMLAQSLGIAALAAGLPELLGDEDKWLTASAAIVTALQPVRKWNRMAQWNYFRAPYWMRRANQASLGLMSRRVVRTWADLGR